MALCMAYVFDRAQCQPLVAAVGRDDNEDEYEDGERPVLAARAQDDGRGGYKDEPEHDDQTSEGADLRLDEQDSGEPSRRRNGVDDDGDDDDDALSSTSRRRREEAREREEEDLLSSREIV